MLWKTIRNQNILFINIPFDERLAYLVETYGKLDKNELIEATIRIQKKLGGLETKNAVEYLNNDDILNFNEKSWNDHIKINLLAPAIFIKEFSKIN